MLIKLHEFLGDIKSFNSIHSYYEHNRIIANEWLRVHNPVESMLDSSYDVDTQ